MKIFNGKKFIRMEVIRLAQRGRKPKPTAVKQLEGNPGKRQLNANEPKPAARAPSCPKWLEDDAKKEWRRLAKQMEQLGILTEVDMAAFAGYCQAYARWKEAEEFISRHGAIVKTGVPFVSVGVVLAVLAASAAGIYCSAVYETDEQVL